MNSIGKNNIWKTVVLPIFIGWRVWYANRLPIMDCDEVYNYWEPLHYMLFGTGMQTWEYSQHFALRTYAYPIPLFLLSKLILLPLLSYMPGSWTSLLALHDVVEVDDNVGNRLALMVLLRSILAASMAWSEVSFLEALSSCNSDENHLMQILLANATKMVVLRSPILIIRTWQCRWDYCF